MSFSEDIDRSRKREENRKMATIESDMSETLITLTSDIVAAHVSNNGVAVEDVPALIHNVYGALAQLGSPAVSVGSQLRPM